MVVPPTSPTRNELRAAMRGRRERFVAGLAAGERARLNEALVERLRPLVAGHACIAGYAAMNDEIDPAGVGVTAWPRVVGSDRPLNFYNSYVEALICDARSGLREPAPGAPGACPDVIIVPLIAADGHGNRLGYGKGFYDRTLPLHDAPRIGVGFDCQVVEDVPAEAWDAPLDWLVTPTRTIRCARPATPPAVGVAAASR